MSLFRRIARTDQTHPITAFWDWWAKQGHEIDPHRNSAAHKRLNQRIEAIHPELTWDFGPGNKSEHRLTVSAGGIADVRPVAERWLRAAPPADATWEFRSSKEAVPNALDGVLEIGGSTIDLSRMLFAVETVGESLRIDVGVHHPVFAQVPEPVRQQVAFLVLDWLLGEDDVERWLDQIEVLETAPAGATDGAGLLGAVASIAENHAADEWSLIEWQNADGASGYAMMRLALRWTDHPTHDVHHGVRVRFVAQDNGLPADDEALETLGSLEEELESLLGSRGVLVGHETISGHRTFHVYTDGEDQNAGAELAEWVRLRRLDIESVKDPAWQLVRLLTG